MNKAFYFAVPARNQQIILVLATLPAVNSNVVYLKCWPEVSVMPCAQPQLNVSATDNL